MHTTRRLLLTVANTAVFTAAAFVSLSILGSFQNGERAILRAVLFAFVVASLVIAKWEPAWWEPALLAPCVALFWYAALMSGIAAGDSPDGSFRPAYTEYIGPLELCASAIVSIASVLAWTAGRVAWRGFRGAAEQRDAADEARDG